MLNGEELLDKSTNIIYEKVPNYDLPVTVLNIAMHKNNPELIPEKHWHRSLEFIIPLTASIEIWANGETYVINRCHVGLINSRDIHTTSVVESDEIFKSIVVQINYEFLKKIYPDYDNIYFSHDINQVVNEELIRLFFALDVEYKRNNESQNIAINGYLYLIISTLLKHQKRTKSANVTNYTDKNLKVLIRIIAYIDENYQQSLDIDLIAEKFGFSYGYLARIFKKQFNMTIKEYITLVRLNHCAYDLLHTNYSITYITMSNGFPNLKSFNQEFQLKYKMTAKAYRNKVRK